MIRLALSLGVGAVTAWPALALSCLPPDPVQTFATVHAAPEPWVVLVGRLDNVNGYPIPEPAIQPDQAGPVLPPLEVGFQGKGLTAEGLGARISTTILLQPVCFGPWCGGWPAGGEVMLFAQVQEDGRYLVPLDPCGQHVFSAPDPAVIGALGRCLAGQDCAAP